MCGLSGLVNVAPGPQSDRVLAAMTATMVRRGPDDSGFWTSPSGTVGLGFRRLSVMDTSPAGHQPMVSGDEGGAIVFNGEVYNFKELRQQLAATGVRFRSNGDTEVVLELLRREGERGLAKLNGMFGLAYVDVAQGTVLLARDHFGIKPLYYATEPSGPGVAFASRYDALFSTGWVQLGDYDPAALACLLEFDTTIAPHGLHRGTGQVRPGHWLRIGPDGIEGGGRWLPADEDPSDAATAQFTITDRAAASAALRPALLASVTKQRVADVPVGLLLSGGIDSPLVGGMLRQAGDEVVHSYTIGSRGWVGDETATAEAFATHLGFDHHTLDLEPTYLGDMLDELPRALHEPISGRSIIQMLAVAKMASTDVTVALGGDGGDELFFGYPQARSLVTNPWIWKAPALVRRGLVAAGRRGVGPIDNGAGLWPSAATYHRAMLGRDLGGAIGSILGGARPPDDVLALFEPPAGGGSRAIAHTVRRAETALHLHAVLRKVDMASMHFGLEVRVPLLDREVAKVAYAIDPRLHVEGGLGKALLRSELATATTAALVQPGKRGFGFAADTWLRTDLRERVESALFDPWDAPIDVAPLRADWEHFVADGETRNGTAWLFWSLFTMRLWHDRVRDDLARGATAEPPSTGAHRP